MKLKSLVTCALLALLVALPLSPAAAQGKEKGLVNDYFPLELGRRWIYKLRVTAGQNTKLIEYKTKVVRQEDVEGIGPCFVTESRSDERLFTTDFYQVKEGQLLNVQRQEGKAVAQFKGRVLLSDAAVTALIKKGSLADFEWKWSSADGRAKGVVRVIGFEDLRIRPFGSLKCIVLRDEGQFSFKEGKVVRHQERKLWFAPGIGMVKELNQVKTAEGKVLLETEALLKHYES